MTKIWEKGSSKLNKEIENYTVGEDYLLDAELLPYDIKASKAHAKMLHSCGYLTKDELADLVSGLDQMAKLHSEGKFNISSEDEDCHTAIENFLIKKLGDTGKKIHTARSRNDQVLTALRLYFIDGLKQEKKEIAKLQESIKSFAKKHAEVPMPGYTHMRKAMPTTVDTLALAYADIFSDDLKQVVSVLEILDKNPLGSAAGYGVPIKIDREMAAKEMGFSKVQENVIHCANSRGKYESLVIHCMFCIMQTLNRIATDIILFSMPEFGFFRLPADLCTGSSIMPQKANPDVLELVRANAHVVHGHMVTVNGITLNLMSGYNRDYQLTKGPAMKSMKIALSSVRIMSLVFSGLEVDKQRLSQAMTPDIFATEKAYKLVEKGVPFRDAYKKVAKEFQ